MAPRRKRQKIQEDGDAVASALAQFSEEYHEPETHDADVPAKSSTSRVSSSLFVRSLPEDATTESLTNLFSESYPLKHATVVTDRATKKSKGYGFVTFTDPDDALKAKEEFNGQLFEGKRIKVEVAEPRHRDGQEHGERPSASSKINGKSFKNAEETRKIPRLIIRNLPWSIKKPEQLTALFQSYGKVKQASLPTQKKGLSSGFGFVLLRGAKNAEKAVAGLNGKEIDGRNITVDWAMDKDSWISSQAAEKKQRLEEKSTSNGDDTPLENDGQPKATQEDDDELMADVDNSDMTSHGSDGDSHSDGTDEMDEADNDELEDAESDEEPEEEKSEDYSGTLFVRNVPFTVTDEILSQHFSKFGSVRYARVVMDHETDRSRGTGFVCFRDPDNALDCLRGAPKTVHNVSRDNKANTKYSVLEDTQADPSGKYTIEGRVLQVSRAVSRTDAHKLEVEGQAAREIRDRDKRRLFLLSEGTISSKSPIYKALSQTELKMREDSSKQRQALIKGNPSLHLSLTRLSIRNIPRHVTSKDLKALAREAVVGFATDVKDHRRQALTKEELSRGGDEMKQAEHDRKVKGKGVVRQAKVVFEGKEGSKVSEKSGAGKSRGYGFVEYSSHRWALMGLRWMNGHLVKRKTTADGPHIQDPLDRPRRLIVEFAIENAQVVARRKTREERASHTGTASTTAQPNDKTARKRKAEEDHAIEAQQITDKPGSKGSAITGKMIGKRRAIRKARKSGK